jgi:hypothetical protein
MKVVLRKRYIIPIGVFLTVGSALRSQEPIRVGTTSAEFLSIGYGSAGCAMGDAYVSAVNNVSGVYWNPAGLSLMEQNEALFNYQPWLADINTFFVSTGLVLPSLGVIALGVIGVDYGEMDVTTVDRQDGTGERFSAKDYAFAFSYARQLVRWFGFGATAKYITSTIWHETASAFAVDLGVIIQTPFFAFQKEGGRGMKIGMSLSNYGTPLKYNGLDLMRSHDELPFEGGNYQDAKVKFETDSWELPLIFRIGVSMTPIRYKNHELIIAADALHVNNNNETINLGVQYMFFAPGLGRFYLRGGYRSLFLKNSEFGPTFGVGLSREYLNNKNIEIDCTYRDVGELGVVPMFSVAIGF